MIVIDAGNARIGRVSAFAAKKLLMGEEVRIINAEEAVISGNPQQIIEKYVHRRQLIFKGNPEKSPYWPKVPDRFVKRLVRGMLPRKKAKGREAYKKLRVFMGKPEEVKGEPVRVEGADLGKLTKYVSIKELCRHLGYTG